MWPFSNKTTLENVGIFSGFTDWHSHILPGVDDGIPDLESALQVLERYEQLGIGEVWLTPHVMEDIPNATVDLRQRFSELLSAYEGTVKLHLAAEYMLDNGFEKRLNSNDLLCIQPPPLNLQSSLRQSQGKYSLNPQSSILVETSYITPPMNLYGIVERIRDKGYRPLLAHPERYIYMEGCDYERLRDMGVHFQCNITSLTGAYGKDARQKFSTFLSKGWIQAMGTDIHRLSSFNHAISRKCIDGRLRKLLMNNGFCG